MEQSPKFKEGDKVRIYVASNNEDLGEWTFCRYDYNMQGVAWFIKDGTGHEQSGDLKMLRIEYAGCQHEWQRVTMFRFDSFCCKHCPVTREFDREKDEAA